MLSTLRKVITQHGGPLMHEEHIKGRDELKRKTQERRGNIKINNKKEKPIPTANKNPTGFMEFSVSSLLRI